MQGPKIEKSYRAQRGRGGRGQKRALLCQTALTLDEDGSPAIHDSGDGP